MYIKKNTTVIKTTEHLAKYFRNLGWIEATEQEFTTYRKKVEACNS